MRTWLIRSINYNELGWNKVDDHLELTKNQSKIAWLLNGVVLKHLFLRISIEIQDPKKLKVIEKEDQPPKA